VPQLITIGTDWRGYLRFGAGKNTFSWPRISAAPRSARNSVESHSRYPANASTPIPDKAHARNALARVAQHGTPAEQKKVEAAVRKRYPSLGKSSKKSQKRSTKGSKQNV